MRIDDVNRSPQAQATEKAKVEPAAIRGDESPASASGADNADISPLARALQPHDSQRLEQLRVDVQSGKYSISGDKVAKAIIGEAATST
jgi:anti-sigma28 factor (negative regulator of flagellin synthesis)